MDTAEIRSRYRSEVVHEDSLGDYEIAHMNEDSLARDVLADIASDDDRAAAFLEEMKSHRGRWWGPD